MVLGRARHNGWRPTWGSHTLRRHLAKPTLIIVARLPDETQARSVILPSVRAADHAITPFVIALPGIHHTKDGDDQRRATARRDASKVGAVV